jgi:hypothetical protein
VSASDLPTLVGIDATGLLKNKLIIVLASLRLGT